jgi:UDP-N-acetylmuramate dehydrogenase
MTKLTSVQIEKLETTFGKKMQKGVLLGRYTACRVGGPADVLILAKTVNQLAEVVINLWDLDIPFVILGGGSNVLISDYGIRQVVILNRAKEMEVNKRNYSVWAGSGANLGQVARKVSFMGLSGLEWAAGLPGTVGGAVYGNSGAHGGDVAGCLSVAEILHQARGRGKWSADQLDYAYRSSILKRKSIEAVILSARFNLSPSAVEATKLLIDEYSSWRRERQPPGASTGSMFKNPNSDYAGRLIDQCGLKGTRIGDAEISPLHANFFINHGRANAAEILALIQLAQSEVKKQFDVELDLEIELLGEWEEDEAT